MAKGTVALKTSIKIINKFTPGKYVYAIQFTGLIICANNIERNIFIFLPESAKN